MYTRYRSQTAHIFKIFKQKFENLRWRLELENYEYDIKFKEGKANVVADALSRKSNDEIQVNTNTDHSIITNPASSLSIYSDVGTIHSAQTSPDYFMRYSDRPIKFYRNQMVFEIGQQPIEKLGTPFLNYNRVTIQKPEYTENDI